jgi:hypothetical protein
MENLFLFLATSFVLRITSPRFRRYTICPGCSSLLHSENRTLHVRYTRDGDRLYFNEYAEDGVTYGLICVQMSKTYSLKEAEKILVHYVNRVRKPFLISCNLSMDVEEDAGLLTLTDYWQDATGFDWKVKGYANGRIVSVLYVKNITDTSVKNHDAYLDGFRFSSAS